MNLFFVRKKEEIERWNAGFLAFSFNFARQDTSVRFVRFVRMYGKLKWQNSRDLSLRYAKFSLFKIKLTIAISIGSMMDRVWRRGFLFCLPFLRFDVGHGERIYRRVLGKLKKIECDWNRVQCRRSKWNSLFVRDDGESFVPFNEITWNG